MEREFVSYEEALALKELGFNEPCFARYEYIKNELQFPFYKPKNHNLKTGDAINYQFISAPLYQQAFRWFREKYFLEKQPLYINENTWRVTDQEEILMKNTKILQNIHTYKDYPTHEEAELECLKKLIEIAHKDDKR